MLVIRINTALSDTVVFERGRSGVGCTEFALGNASDRVELAQHSNRNIHLPAHTKSLIVNMTAKKIITATCLLLSAFLTGCSPAPALPSPPLSLPFAVHKAGSKIETTFLIRENRTYLFALEYRYEPGNKEKNELIDKFAGRKKRDANGNYVSMLVPIDLRLKLMRISLENGTEQVLHDKEFSEHQPDSKSADSLIRGIAYIPLDIGYYRIDIENLRDAPELAEIAVNFTLIEFYRK